MTRTSSFLGWAVAGAVVIGLAGAVLPSWNFVLSIGLAKGLAVLGLVLLMRGGLVSFGQGLYYAIGGYTVGLLVNFAHVTDALVLLAASAAAAAVVAAVVGLLLARYRDIFFAMLTLALSMILFGLLVKSSGLGGTDGFNIKAVSLLGIPLSGAHRLNGLFLLLVLAVLAALNLFFFNKTAFGRLLPGIKDNEIRVEYLGASATLSIHIAYVLAAAVAALGGAMSGIVVGHVDPELAFWATSGEFVVIAVLAGTGNMLTPFVAALVLEVVRSYAYQHAPNLWQMVLGAIILALILFMPDGLGGIKLGSRKTEAPR